MNKAVNVLNSLLTKGMDIICSLLGVFPRGAQLVILSIIAGVILLLLYWVVSNQDRLRLTKNRIYASFLEAVLFRHDSLITLRAQARMFGLGFLYFMCAVPPILILMIPCVLLLGQLNLRYGYKALEINKDYVLSVTLKDLKQVEGLELRTDGKIEAVTPTLRILEDKKALWRVRPNQEGSSQISVGIKNSSNSQEDNVYVSNEPKAISSGIVSSWWMGLLYPGERLIAAESPVYEIWINYPEMRYEFLGFKWHWLVVFLLVSIASGLVASKVFGVEV